TWHRFPSPGGVTGMWLLSESHLTIHSFPEFGSVCLNPFCCRQRSALDWRARLTDRLGAKLVQVNELRRPYRTTEESEPSRERHEPRDELSFVPSEDRLS